MKRVSKYSITIVMLVTLAFVIVYISQRRAQRTPGTEQRPLVVQFPTYGGYAPGILYNRGLNPNAASLFRKRHQLDVNLKVIDAPDTAISAFVKGGRRGGVDIMSFTLDMYAATYLELENSGLDTVAILLTSWSYGGDAIAASHDIRVPGDLQGKRIACAQITPSHFYAIYVLDRAGLGNADVEWIFTQTAIDAANVFKAGRADACVSWAPDVYTAAEDREGGHILASTKEANRLIGDIFIVKREFAETYPDVIARFCRGWLEGVEMARDEPDLAATHLAAAFRPAGIDKDAAHYLMSVVQFADIHENLRFFGLSPRGGDVTYHSIYESASELWRKFGIVDAFAPVNTTYYSKHLESLDNN